GPVGVAWTPATGDLSLSPILPNPVRAAASIRFFIPEPEPVTLAIYDLSGRRVAQLLDGDPRPAGLHELSIDTRGWRSGCYFCRLDAGSERRMERMIVVR